MLRIYLLILILAISSSSWSLTIDELRQAFYRGDYEGAAQMIEDYEASLAAQKKKKKKKAADVPVVDYSEWQERIELGKSMLDRVEKIAIIDSITVDSASFFRAYHLSAPTGSIRDVSSLPKGLKGATQTTVFTTESGEKMIWGASDDNGHTHLVQSSLLSDGSWEQPTPLGDGLMLGANANYPFLMSDGMTLYYASDGEGSLGGYDIFISRNDGDSFLQPQNIGMPYNSPYNDYMLAIDELTGVGWWATDRNQIKGCVTIYVFIPQELRINYPVDTPDLAGRAFITNISATQQDGVDYASALKAIKAIDDEEHSKAADFYFAVPGKGVYTSLNDFQSSAAKQAMNEYLAAQQELNTLSATLADMRLRYAGGNTKLATQILEAEQQQQTMRATILRISNSVVRAEIGNNK